jgi:hypothetical protein
MGLQVAGWQGPDHRKVTEFRQLRAICVSGRSGCCGYESELAFFFQDIIGLVEARAATGGLAQSRVAGFRIARNVTRRTAQFVFADRITDANVHSKTPAIDSQEHI